MDNRTTSDTQTWPQLAEALYGILTGRGATIEYLFEDMENRRSKFDERRRRASKVETQRRAKK